MTKAEATLIIETLTEADAALQRARLRIQAARPGEMAEERELAGAEVEKAIDKVQLIRRAAMAEFER